MKKFENVAGNGAFEIGYLAVALEFEATVGDDNRSAFFVSEESHRLMAAA